MLKKIAAAILITFAMSAATGSVCGSRRPRCTWEEEVTLSA